MTTILFDFDGVIADTEHQYDVFFDRLEEEYHLGDVHLATCAYGTTLDDLLDQYFQEYGREERQKIIAEMEEFELNMDYPLVPGIMDLLRYLRDNHYKIGLVTSSNEPKMKFVLAKLHLADFFDTLVTAAQVTKGKPDPMCYLLGAENLGSKPQECLVFEDSLPGIEAGKNAGMKVVGLATTLPAEELQGHVRDIIPDFTDIDQVKSFLV